MTGPAASAPQGLPVRLVGGLGAQTLEVLQSLGRFGRFLFHAITYVFVPPFKLSRLAERIHFIGFRSLTIVVLTGAFTGMVLGLQVFLVLSRFGSEAFLGPAVALSIIRELGPVLCALIVTGLSGSGAHAQSRLLFLRDTNVSLTN
jgi:phospholipid/cholesterol/gamma-HCH transport system permease protein